MATLGLDCGATLIPGLFHPSFLAAAVPRLSGRAGVSPTPDSTNCSLAVTYLSLEQDGLSVCVSRQSVQQSLVG